jgi:hypothetical protein
MQFALYSLIIHNCFCLTFVVRKNNTKKSKVCIIIYSSTDDNVNYLLKVCEAKMYESSGDYLHNWKSSFGSGKKYFRIKYKAVRPLR